MEKYVFSGKTEEEALENALTELSVEKNDILYEVKEQKGGLFKGKKVEVTVIKKSDVNEFIKETVMKIVTDMGFNAQIEIKNKEEIPTYVIYSDNDALLIGKNGKNLTALSTVVSQHLNKELGRNYKFIIDINAYKEKRDKNLERLAKKIAREVATTKVEAKLDSMNSYERRIIHNALTNSKKVYTESEGEEPNRYVVIKPKED